MPLTASAAPPPAIAVATIAESRRDVRAQKTTTPTAAVTYPPRDEVR
jgi:hypothetical protein